MHPETFEHQAAVYEYAERNGLTYAWEGSPAFAKRLRVLSPEQYQILAAHTRRGVRKVLLFSKDVLAAVEGSVTDISSVRRLGSDNKRSRNQLDRRIAAARPPSAHQR